jgi:hypothetical protein
MAGGSTLHSMAKRTLWSSSILSWQVFFFSILICTIENGMVKAETWPTVPNGWTFRSCENSCVAFHLSVKENTQLTSIRRVQGQSWQMITCNIKGNFLPSKMFISILTMLANTLPWYWLFYQSEVILLCILAIHITYCFKIFIQNLHPHKHDFHSSPGQSRVICSTTGDKMILGVGRGLIHVEETPRKEGSHPLNPSYLKQHTHT